MWNQKIHSRFFEFQESWDESSLTSIVEEYAKLLQETTIAFEDKVLLKDTILSHLEIFHASYSNLHVKSSETGPYLKHIEDIVTYYCDLELVSAHKLRKQSSNKSTVCLKVAKRIRAVLTLYLKDVQRHIFHVLMKITKDAESKTTKKIMLHVYM